MDDYERYMQKKEEEKRLLEKKRQEELQADLKREAYIRKGKAEAVADAAQKQAEFRREHNKEQQAREQAALNKSMDAATFRSLVEMYKKEKGAFARFSSKVKGEAPEWNKISGYSTEVLDYLKDVAQGNTYRQRREEKSHADAMEKARKASGRDEFRGYSADTLHKKHFNQFVRKLSMSEPELLKEIQKEKDAKAADYARFGRDMSR